MWRWTYTRYSGAAYEEQKKGVIGVYISNFETYTRYFWVADDEQKKVLESECHYKFSKGGNLKKEFGKPWSKVNYNMKITYLIVTYKR